MFSFLGTIFILTVIFYAFYIPLKKLYYALSPKKRAIREAEEEWKMRNEIQNRKILSAKCCCLPLCLNCPPTTYIAVLT